MKRKSWLIIVAVIMSILVACDEPKDEATTYDVLLEVTSEVSPLIVTYQKGVDDTYTDSVSVFPWSKSFTGNKGDEVSVGYQNNGEKGPASVSIKVDGVEIVASSCSWCESESIGYELGWTFP